MRMRRRSPVEMWVLLPRTAWRIWVMTGTWKMTWFERVSHDSPPFGDVTVMEVGGAVIEKSPSLWSLVGPPLSLTSMR